MKSFPFFVFVPWLAFLNQGGVAKLHDGDTLKIFFAKECSRPKKIFNVKVAKTTTAQQNGLSGRTKKLSFNEGMIFVMHPPRMVTFWMHETYIPLQLIFTDGAGLVSGVRDMPVESDPKDPEKTYSAPSASTAAIELAPNAISEKSKGQMLCVIK